MDTNSVKELQERIDRVLDGYDTLDSQHARALVTVECLNNRLQMALLDLDFPAGGITAVLDGENVTLQFVDIRHYDKFVCKIEDLRDLRKGNQ